MAEVKERFFLVFCRLETLYSTYSGTMVLRVPGEVIPSEKELREKCKVEIVKQLNWPLVTLGAQSIITGLSEITAEDAVIWGPELAARSTTPPVVMTSPVLTVEKDSVASRIIMIS